MTESQWIKKKEYKVFFIPSLFFLVSVSFRKLLLNSIQFLYKKARITQYFELREKFKGISSTFKCTSLTLVNLAPWNFEDIPFNKYLENGEKPTIGDIGAGVGQLGAWLKSQVKPRFLKGLETMFYQ